MYRILLFVLLSSLTLCVSADQRTDTQRQLEAAHQDIAELKKRLESLQQEKSTVQRQLRKTETEIGTLENQVDDLQRKLKDNEKEIQRLDQEKKKLHDARLRQQRLIAIQARSAYQSGRQEYLKLLLNQESPEQLSRTLTYYDYLNRARVEQIQGFNDTLQQLAQVEQRIERQQQQLQAHRTQLDQRLSELATLRKQRQQTLARINTEYTDRNKRLSAREQEREQLARLLQTIEETLARQAREAELERQRAQARHPDTGQLVSTGTVYGGPFSKARGKLPWPVDGRLVAHYGTPRSSDSRTKWDGVLIGAPAGTQVHAIHGGRVVFADWLRGAGLLVILDHGSGYLSLYGHNQSLLKKAGDLVEAGEPIATVGSSGGQEIPALYFAIRQAGQPSDPAQWCSAQG